MNADNTNYCLSVFICGRLLLPPPPVGFRPRLATDGRFRFRRACQGWVQLTQDPIVDPVLVPPFARIHLYAIDLHAEVNVDAAGQTRGPGDADRKSTRLNSSHLGISYAVFCLKKK